MVVEFKRIFDAGKQTTTCPYVEVFPESPSLLPQDVYNHCSKESGPVEKEIPCMPTVLQHVPLRKSSALLKQPAEATTPNVSSASSNHVTWDQIAMLINSAPNVRILQKSAANEAEISDLGLGVRKALGSGFPPAIPPLAVAASHSSAEEKTPTRPPAISMGDASPLTAPKLFEPTLRIDAPAVPEEPAPKTTSTAEPKATSTEEYEQAALRALLEKKEKAKAAIAAKAATKKAAQAKAKQGADSMVKKGSCKQKGQKLSAYIVRWDPHYGQSRKHWVSAHYHNAKTQAEKAGLSADNVKAAAQEAYKAAADLWDKHR
jgi:hypothetical protein